MRSCGFGCGHIDVRAVSAWPVHKGLRAQNEASKKNRRTAISKQKIAWAGASCKQMMHYTPFGPKERGAQFHCFSSGRD